MHNTTFLVLLNDFINDYIISVKGLSFNTQKSYKYSFQLLINYFYTIHSMTADTIKFDDLNLDTITDFLEWLEKKRRCSVSTRNQRLAALSSFSIYSQIRSVEAAITFRKAVMNIPKKRTVQTQRMYFTKEEIKILFSLPNKESKIGKRDKTILALMYASGMRAQEVCDLKVKDIKNDKTRTMINIVGKGNKFRRISIPSSPALILLKHIKRSNGTTEQDQYVFSSQTHKHMSTSCIEEIYKKYIKTAKKEYPNLFKYTYSPHSMRHTTATHMVEAGVPLLVVKNFLGHSSIQTTQIYASVTQETLNKQLKIWNQTWLNNNCSSLEEEKQDIIPLFLK